VTSLNPTGELTVGNSIDVHYWGAEPATTPTTPTTETTTPTDTTGTDTGGLPTTEGANR